LRALTHLGFRAACRGRIQAGFEKAGRFLTDAFRTRILSASCTSVLRGSPLVLPGQFIREASDVSIELILQKPLADPRSPAVRVNVTDPDGRVLASSAQIHSRHSGRRRLACVAVKILPTHPVQQRTLRVEVQGRSPRHVLGRFDFHSLDEASLVSSTHERVLQELHLERQALWVEAGPICYRSDQIPSRSDAVLVPVAFRSTGFNACVSHWETTLSLNAVFGERRQPLCEIPIVLSENVSVARVLSAPVQGSALAASDAGLCCLTVAVAGRNLGVLPLRTVSDSDLLERLQLRSLAIDAIGVDGRRTCKVRVIRRNRYQYLQAWVVVVTDLLAPNSSFPAVLDWMCAGTLLHRDEFTVTLDQPSRRFTLPPLQVDAFALPDQAELTITVQVGSTFKQSASLLILPDERIANFEGRLNVDTEQLVVHEGEYEEILRRLDSGSNARSGASSRERPRGE
jgi:hypothetical protein